MKDLLLFALVVILLGLMYGQFEVIRTEANGEVRWHLEYHHTAPWWK